MSFQITECDRKALHDLRRTIVAPATTATGQPTTAGFVNAIELGQQLADLLLPYVSWGPAFNRSFQGDWTRGRTPMVGDSLLLDWLNRDPELSHYRSLVQHVVYCLERQSPGYVESAAGSDHYLHIRRP